MAPNDSSSDDLSFARELSRLLAGQGTGPVAVHYADFGRRREARRMSISPVPSEHPQADESQPSPVVELHRPLIGQSAWEQLLDECVQRCGGHSAFATDQSGLIVASRGSVTSERSQQIGARIVLAYEQADAIAGEFCPSLLLEVQEGVLSAFRLRTELDAKITLVVISEFKPSSEQTERVVSYLAAVSASG